MTQARHSLWAILAILTLSALPVWSRSWQRFGERALLAIFIRYYKEHCNSQNSCKYLADNEYNKVIDDHSLFCKIVLKLTSLFEL
jgi:hypothetical protein